MEEKEWLFKLIPNKNNMKANLPGFEGEIETLLLFISNKPSKQGEGVLILFLSKIELKK